MRRGIAALVTACLAAGGAACGDSDPAACRGAVQVGAELNLIAVRKTDGSLWTWGQRPRDHGTPNGIRTRPEREALDVSGASFVDGGLCVREPSGDVRCPFFVDTVEPPFAFPDHPREAAFWLSAVQFQPLRGPPSVCAVAAGGALTCRWGWWDDLTYVTRGPGAAKLSLGADHFCALGPDGAVTCESGGDNRPPGLVPVWQRPPAEIAGAVQLVSTEFAACARTAAGEVLCWGSFDYQAAPAFTIAAPARVTGLGGAAVALVAGERHACALRADGAVLCWGDGLPVITPGPRPSLLAASQIPGLPRPATSLASARAAVCAVLDDGTVWCWGGNSNGETGDGAALLGTASITAVPFEALPRAVVTCE